MKELTQRKITSREFNQNVAKAKKAAQKGPVTITDRGRAAFVLMTQKEYDKLRGGRQTLFDLVGQSGPDADFDFDPPRLGGSLLRRIDLD
jgi:prevent-host-death family protein